MPFQNLTPHPIKLLEEDGSLQVVEPSGRLARVRQDYTRIAVLNGVPCTERQTLEVTGMPDPQPGVVYLVSFIVFGAIKDQRKDIACTSNFTYAQDGSRDHAKALVVPEGFQVPKNF